MAMIDSFNNINELTNDDGRIVRANFTLKLQGYVVPDNLQKKLKEQNTKFFSKAQIVLNQATTVIEEPSTRSQVLRKTSTIPTTGGGGGGSLTNITEAQDEDWIINQDKVISTRDVSIQHQLRVELSDPIEDMLLIKKNGVNFVGVNSDGILNLSKEFLSFPDAVEGGLLYKENNFYLGLG